MIKLTLNNSTHLDEVAFIVNRQPYVVNRKQPINLELERVNFIGVEAIECEGDFIDFELNSNIIFRCVQLGNKLKLAF